MVFGSTGLPKACNQRIWGKGTVVAAADNDVGVDANVDADIKVGVAVDVDGIVDVMLMLMLLESMRRRC